MTVVCFFLTLTVFLDLFFANDDLTCSVLEENNLYRLNKIAIQVLAHGHFLEATN